VPVQAPQDTLQAAGYLPGYRAYQSLGASPFTPPTGAFPGGITPAYAAPMPAGDWTFRFTGFLNITGQFSVNERQGGMAPGFALHTPPTTVDEYQSFVGTATLPGQWVALNFKYGNRAVSANLSLSTWNPSNPTTYYQIGSQGFVNNAYLDFEIPSVGPLRVRAQAGYFYNYYGLLSQYGNGIYQNPSVGGPRGVGILLQGDTPLTPDLTLLIEGGFMGNRNGKNPIGTAPAGANSGVDPLWAAAYVHHLHVGLQRKGDFVVTGRLHYLMNWSADDRGQLPIDNETGTRGVNEASLRNGHISVYGASVVVSHGIWGWLGVGGSHVRGENAYTLRGLITFGGEGDHLTRRWWGENNDGTGTLSVVSVNYFFSLGKIVSAPIPFNGDGPDLQVNLGGVIATTSTTHPEFDGRVRYKFGGDFLYKFLFFMGAGLRLDRVVPSSHDADQTFHVAAARLVFKTDWNSRESLMLLYAKWFYGPNSHPEYSNLVRPWLDDQLVALNVNMWW
jgi:hypothetical protein